jgi:hypothetical protein
VGRVDQLPDRVTRVEEITQPLNKGGNSCTSALPQRFHSKHPGEMLQVVLD